MGNYITTLDCAAEGISAQEDRLEELIEWAEEWIENECGQRFYESSRTELTLDGKYDPVLLLPQPIISIVSVEEDGVALTSTAYAIYNRRPPDEDDRKYPRLVRLTSLSRFDSSGNLLDETNWAPGNKNIVVEGTFGYTENIGGNEVAPKQIKRAVLRLVAAELARVGVDDEIQAQRIRKYMSSFGAGELRVSLSELAQSGGPSGIVEIDRVVRAFSHANQARRPAFQFGGG